MRNRIPITLCAEGPQTLHLGGRLFDGVIAGTGLLPEVISDTIERVAAGVREAGRNPSEVEVWFTTRSSLDTDRDKAIERIYASVSSILNHSMRFGLEGKNVPGQLRAKIAEYVEGYELYDHVLQAGRNPKRMAELGLTEYGLERFALAGNVKPPTVPAAREVEKQPIECSPVSLFAVSRVYLFIGLAIHRVGYS